MTSLQEKAVARIKRDFESLYPETVRGEYEIKQFKVTDEKNGLVFVYAVMGLVGHECTLTQDIAHFIIGKRGGVQFFKTVYDKNGHYKNTVTPRYTGNIWAAVCGYR